MIKILKHLKPYWKWVIVIFALLMVQAQCDLALPTYTSNIIDTGIQNQGVEQILPVEMTVEDYTNAQLFMTSEEKEFFAECYKMGEENYCLIEEAEDWKDEDWSEVDKNLLIPLVMSYQMQAMSNSEEEITFTATEGIDVEPEQFIAALNAGMITDDVLLSLRDSMQEQIDALGSSTLKSMGIAFAIQCDKNAGIDVEEIQMNYLWKSGFQMLAIALIMAAAAIAVGYCASRVGAGIGRDLRKRTFGTVVSYSNAEMDQFSTASLITRSTNDIQQVQNVCIMFLRMLLYAPIIGIGGVIKVAETKAGMEWIIALAVLVILGFVMVLMSVTLPKFKMMQTLIDKLNLVAREILTGLSVIRAFSREEREEQRFDEANKNLTKNQLFTNRVMAIMMPGMSMIMYCVNLLIVWVAAHKIDDGMLQVGAMTAFITYTMQIVMAFLMLTVMSIMLPRAGVAAGRIDEVLNTKSTILDSIKPIEKKEKKGVLEFKNVCFRYQEAEEDVLSDINFVAEPGKTTAIIGSTGCGKSTIVNLIPRFFDVTAGVITLDGADIRDYSLSDLRESIGFVPQKGVLFSGTIASNLRFGKKDATQEEIAEAAQIAQAEDFIEAKDEKYESHIAQGGSNVSGGQKQRLAIARAIVKKAKIYVFDDSFSALDMKTDVKLRKALEETVKDSTVLIVAQRISTILHADQILVLEDGKIVGKGTHEELLHNCEVYNQIARSQLSAKELGLDEKEEI